MTTPDDRPALVFDMLANPEPAGLEPEPGAELQAGPLGPVAQAAGRVARENTLRGVPREPRL